MALGLDSPPIGRELRKAIIILENLVVDVIQQRVDGVDALVNLIWMWRLIDLEVQLAKGRRQLIDNDSYFRYILSHVVIGLVQLLNIVLQHLHLFYFHGSHSSALEAEPLWISWGQRSRATILSASWRTIHVDCNRPKILHRLAISLRLYLLSIPRHRARLRFLGLILGLEIFIFHSQSVGDILPQLRMALALVHFLRDSALRRCLRWPVDPHGVGRSHEPVGWIFQVIVLSFQKVVYFWLRQLSRVGPTLVFLRSCVSALGPDHDEFWYLSLGGVLIFLVLLKRFASRVVRFGTNMVSRIVGLWIFCEIYRIQLVVWFHQICTRFHCLVKLRPNLNLLQASAILFQVGIGDYLRSPSDTVSIFVWRRSCGSLLGLGTITVKIVDGAASFYSPEAVDRLRRSFFKVIEVQGLLLARVGVFWNHLLVLVRWRFLSTSSRGFSFLLLHL